MHARMPRDARSFGFQRDALGIHGLGVFFAGKYEEERRKWCRIQGGSKVQSNLAKDDGPRKMKTAAELGVHVMDFNWLLLINQEIIKDV